VTNAKAAVFNLFNLGSALLNAPDVYVIAKGKDHKQYEYGNKVTIVSTKDTNIIVGVASHDKNIHDAF
jgi:IS5 family transposase